MSRSRISGNEVRQLGVLQPTPHEFDRVQLGCVGRESLQVHPGIAAQERADHQTLVCVCDWSHHPTPRAPSPRATAGGSGGTRPPHRPRSTRRCGWRSTTRGAGSGATRSRPRSPTPCGAAPRPRGSPGCARAEPSSCAPAGSGTTRSRRSGRDGREGFCGE